MGYWLFLVRSGINRAMEVIDFIDTADSVIDLATVQLRLIRNDERERWDELMRAHHYLGLSALVGRSLRYVAEAHDQWVALLGWASAAFKCAPRDAWIGWSAPIQWQRISFIVNNCRFLI